MTTEAHSAFPPWFEKKLTKENRVDFVKSKNYYELKFIHINLFLDEM